MRTILVVVGTRPEAIKMAPVVGALRREAGVRTLVCATGQHRELLDQALSMFGIAPNVDLGAMTPGQALSPLMVTLIAGLDGVLEQTRPDWVLAQGDTASVFATALAAFHRGVRFGHVEAGLRTGDLTRPFPEEGYRRLTSAVASAHFAPTDRARRALIAEGHAPEAVHLTGNTIVDALNEIVARPYDGSVGPLAGLPVGRRLVLLTTHRRESFGAPLAEVCSAVYELAETFEDAGVHLVCPVHPNPQVRGPILEALSGLRNVSLTGPLDYASMVALLTRCTLILTDSGGIQEEAVALQVPVLVLRTVTERPEGVEAGLARLVGTDRTAIVREAGRVLRANRMSPSSPGPNPYGDGRAAARIVDVLLRR